MQTFIPFYFYSNCAKALSNERLYKQRLECFQIHRAAKKGGAWANHPATKMWQVNETLTPTFYRYWQEICIECDFRGIKDPANLKGIALWGETVSLTSPWWVGEDAYYAVAYTHAVNLWKKGPFYYAKLFREEALPHIQFQEYLWPCMDGSRKLWRFVDSKHKKKEFLSTSSAEVKTLITLHMTQVLEPYL